MKIMRAGLSRGLGECQRLYKDELWDCSFYNKSVTGNLPDFVQRTLPYGKRSYNYFMHASYTKQLDSVLSRTKYIADIQASYSSFYLRILLILLL